MNLSTSQLRVLDDVFSITSIGSSFQKPLYSLTTVGGYAGTGKTTLIGGLRKRIYKERPYLNVAFLTFTGKASSVLKIKLEENKSLFSGDYCGTIHGLIYEPITRWNKKLKTFIVEGWRLKDPENLLYDIIIIDEASMVSKELFEDLKIYKKPIIAFGDHGQLPPIGGNGFNLMSAPTFMLTEVHRQALGSPIIKISEFIRNEGYIPFGFFSDKVFKVSWDDKMCKRIWNEKIPFLSNDMTVLCSFNKTRVSLNKMIRSKLNFTQKAPYPSEKIICLSNNHDLKIMNGQIGNVVWLVPDSYSYRITMKMDNEIYDCLITDKCFGEVTYTIYDKSTQIEKLKETCKEKGYNTIDFFDYGYAMSVHKSQGSEWDKIVLFEQRASMWDDEYYAKLLYTAVTRAKNSLMVITDAWL